MKTFKIIQNMKSKILVLIITISLFACGKNENKQSELLKLKAKRDKIDEQIAILEKEISESNTGNEKKKYFLVSTETLKFKPFNKLKKCSPINCVEYKERDKYLNEVTSRSWLV